MPFTGDELVRFILSDCQDPELKARAKADMDEIAKSPEFKASIEMAAKDLSDHYDELLAEWCFRDAAKELTDRYDDW